MSGGKAGATGTAEASEGGASYYFPGAFGSFLISTPPEPGFSVASQTLYFSADTSRAVLRGRAQVGLSVEAIYEYIGAFYTFNVPALGARVQTGVALPVIGSAKIASSFDSRLFSTTNADSDTGFGDIMFNPFNVFWNFGDFNVKLTQFVIAPTGRYDVNKTINVGRNYWGIDTQLGLTWFHKATGTEVSVLPGIMFNTTNQATDCAFMGESVGIGPAVLLVPDFLKGRAAIVGKWLFDVSATNRLKGNWGQIALTYRF